MLTRAQIVGLKVLFVVGGSIFGFAVCQTWYRSVEARASVALVRFFEGRSSVALTTTHTSIAIIPHHGFAFVAIITPSCSATASILAIACLASLSPRFGRLRRLTATALALISVALGNIARISLSVIAGVHAGISSLVLFHDWIGGVMTFVYTLGGYILMLAILLPNTRKQASAAQATEGDFIAAI